MSTKISIYHNEDFEIYSDCFDENILFIKIKKPKNFSIEANSSQKSKHYSRLEIVTETNIENFKEIADNFLKWYNNSYKCKTSKKTI